MVNNLYKLLKNKDIIAILDGDVSFGEYEFNDLSKTDMSLPYLSGPKICELSLQFGSPQTYSIMSRWQIFLFLFSRNKNKNFFKYILSI